MYAIFMCQRQIKSKDTLRAKNFFLSRFPEHHVQSIERILVGYSNKTFLLKTEDNQEFKVRLAENKYFISRKNEQEILKLVADKNLLFYDAENGNAIYRWIQGWSLVDVLCAKTSDVVVKNHRFGTQKETNTKLTEVKRPLSDEEMLKVYDVMKTFHNVKLSANCEVLVHDAFDYFAITKDNIARKYQEIYKEMVDKYKDLPRVLCHNDVSEKNIICDTNNNLHLIDYEWGRLNVAYWDLGNWIRNSNLNSSQIYKLSKMVSCTYEILLDFAFMASYYALQLSYSFGKGRVSESYLIKTFNQLEMYLSWKQSPLLSATAQNQNLNTSNFRIDN